MQIKPIKYVIDLLVPVITHIFNSTFSTGIFPELMQIAKITAIHKGGEVNHSSNYRPISILPVFSKSLEKSYSSLTNFLDKHSLL